MDNRRHIGIFPPIQHTPQLCLSQLVTHSITRIPSRFIAVADPPKCTKSNTRLIPRACTPRVWASCACCTLGCKSDCLFNEQRDTSLMPA
jgi:hypothetical protein